MIIAAVYTHSLCNYWFHPHSLVLMKISLLINSYSPKFLPYEHTEIMPNTHLKHAHLILYIFLECKMPE